MRFGADTARLDPVVVARLRDEFVAATAAVARAQAQQSEILAQLQSLVLGLELSEQESAVMLRSLASECAVPARLGERSVSIMMGASHALSTLFPDVFDALAQGAITMPHVKAVLRESALVPEEHLREYETRCLEQALVTTPARLTGRARVIAEELSPHTIDERHAVAAAQRRVWVNDLPDGMAELRAVLPAVLAYAAKDRVDRVAKAVKAQAVKAQSESETSSAVPGLAAIRADVLAEILLTGVGSGECSTTASRVLSGVRGAVSVVIPVGGAATLTGYGPIDSGTAREFAAVAPGWDHTTVDIDGSLLATERRQPTEKMRQILRARDQHCRFPGCATVAVACEIDHTVEWANGGATAIWNLSHLCGVHHLLKHPDLRADTKWRVTQDDAGVLTWVSPAGATYVDRPERSYSVSEPQPDEPP